MELTKPSENDSLHPPSEECILSASQIAPDLPKGREHVKSLKERLESNTEQRRLACIPQRFLEKDLGSATDRGHLESLIRGTLSLTKSCPIDRATFRIIFDFQSTCRSQRGSPERMIMKRSQKMLGVKHFIAAECKPRMSHRRLSDVWEQNGIANMFLFNCDSDVNNGLPSTHPLHRINYHTGVKHLLVRKLILPYLARGHELLRFRPSQDVNLVGKDLEYLKTICRSATITLL